MAQRHSIVEYFGLGEGHRCGYCKSDTGNISHGMWSHVLTCRDYEDLLNRGWRRSGKFVYKPLMNQTCCPQYTIRCDVSKIKLSKSQKKVLRRLNKYLLDGKDTTRRKQHSDGTDLEETRYEAANDIPFSSEMQATTDITSVKFPATKSTEGIAATTPKAMESNNQVETGNTVSNMQKPGDGPSSEKSGRIVGMDSSLPKCRKAKEIRKERKLQKLKFNAGKEGKQLTETDLTLKNCAKSTEKSIEDYIDEPSKFTKSAHKLEVRLVRSHPQSDEFTESFETEFLLFQKYQVAIHKEQPYENSESQFRRFLVDSPLEAEYPGSDSKVPPTGLGSFHQQYFLDGKLIAVGVLDILPHCVSSKYFFYDPEYEFLSLGTFSALQEIYFIRSLHQAYSEMKYYYMGFYIHSCHKMRYKGHYHPSFLLCPEKFTFVPISQCIPKLNEAKYSRLDNGEDTKEDPIDIWNTLVLYQRQGLPYFLYEQMLPGRTQRQEQRAEVTEYTTLTGQKVAERMLLYRKNYDSF